jgi:hypothetical protein
MFMVGFLDNRAAGDLSEYCHKILRVESQKAIDRRTWVSLSCPPVRIPSHSFLVHRFFS